MANICQLPHIHVLGPDDLRLAADAFEAALHCIGESTCEHSPHATRRLLAHYVIERALAGERDFVALRDGALCYVRRPASAQAA
jgi:hypothetical protein